MAKLSELHRLIGNYLELHGDKEVTSISTWCSSDPQEYTLNLHDIFDGPIGANPYSGEDCLNIPKGNSKRRRVNDESRLPDK